MTQKTRRKVLKGLAVTIPAAWTTPVVESVILPAHAGGSFIPECSDDGDCPDDQLCVEPGFCREEEE